MSEQLEKSIEFCRRAVELNGMAIAWVVYYVCDKEIKIKTKKHPKGFRFLNGTWRNDAEIASPAI